MTPELQKKSIALIDDLIAIGRVRDAMALIYEMAEFDRLSKKGEDLGYAIRMQLWACFGLAERKDRALVLVIIEEWRLKRIAARIAGDLGSRTDRLSNLSNLVSDRLETER